MRTAIFGGTFDPVHRGHLEVIRMLLARGDALIVAPTLANPWKSAPQASFEQRREMLQIALDSESIAVCDSPQLGSVCIVNLPYIYSAELLSKVQQVSWFSGNLADYYWAVGADQGEAWRNWKNWAEQGVEVVSLPVTVDEHSTDIRAGRAELLPALEYYTSINSLYSRGLVASNRDDG